MTFVDTFLGLTSLGAKPDMEQVNNAIKMDDPYEVVRMFCEANGMGREDFTASLVAPYDEHNPAAQGKIATAPIASPIARFLLFY